VRLVLAAGGAKFFHLEPLGRRLLVFRAGVVPVFALLALERNDFSWHNFVTSSTAEPTIR
jgi:hypothetical protein